MTHAPDLLFRYAQSGDGLGGCTDPKWVRFVQRGIEFSAPDEYVERGLELMAGNRESVGMGEQGTHPGRGEG